MSTIHLITTCAKSKNGPIQGTVYPYDTQDIDDSYLCWKKCIQDRYTQGTDNTKIHNLYRGAHWNTAKKIAAAYGSVNLWVVSAGLGLRHDADPAIPYESSFTMMRQCSADVWERLITDPVLPGKVSSLEGLLGHYYQDSFVIAASPTYLNAIEHDLVKGITHLHDPKMQLTIASSAAYTGVLTEYVRYGDRMMMKALKANMTTLNIKHAGVIIAALSSG